MNKLRIVFMGTPDFATGILEAILQENYEVVAVITAPDKPAGRGQKLSVSSVKQFALEKGLKILQPTNLKDESFLEELKSLNANLQVVVAFRMLPKQVWQMPELGTFNLHASLLPDYRGAAPINWAIINGETKTGVTTFFIDEKIDTGAIILSDIIEISESENAGNLHDRLMNLGKKTVINTLKLIEQNAVKTTIQPNPKDLKTAYKLNKENTKIDWTKPLDQIYNLIRGLSPYPCAWTVVEDNQEQWTVKIYEVEKEKDTHNHKIGKIISNKKEIKIAVSGGYISIKSLQFPGKKRMRTTEFLNGFTFSDKAKAL
ncbi:MAG: methionyl-tRNA formyltransferase [Flavobacteriaceae bacterium]